jgi:pimeloyl-ACP methyl ester carboxylesterase
MRGAKQALPSPMPYEVSGDGKGTPVVLVPGGLSGWASWKPHAEVLSRHHRVVRVQLLNMAAAERGRRPVAGYSLRSESAALARVLDEIGADHVHLVGWSHGGAVALDLALDHPDRLRSLTLIEPAAYWVALAYGEYEDEVRSYVEMLGSFHDPPTDDDLEAFLVKNGLVPPGQEAREMPRWPLWSSLKVALASLHTVTEHTDDIKRLRALHDMPVLLVKGRESRGFNFGGVELIARSLGPRARIITLPDGHASHIVAMDRFLAELEDFLGDAS